MGSATGSLKILLAVFFTTTCLSTPAFALDKRLKLMFKTAGYGAAGGLVIGAGTMALGMGGFRNVLMGASTGMYAGILLAAYIVATPDEEKQQKRIQNPYAPRRPLGPDDYEDGNEDDFKDNLKSRPDSRRAPVKQLAVPDKLAAWPEKFNESPKQRELLVWAPLVSLHW